MSLDGVETSSIEPEVELGELRFRARLLESIIAEYEGDPRLPEPLRQLEIIRGEIEKRERMATMADYNRMTIEELDAVREKMQAVIEEMQTRFVEAGKALERKRFEAGLHAEIDKLEQRKQELAAQVEKADQVVGLKTLDLKAKFNKLMGR